MVAPSPVSSSRACSINWSALRATPGGVGGAPAAARMSVSMRSSTRPRAFIAARNLKPGRLMGSDMRPS
jgi:hypothetical protein